jgi:hypothetical protein
MLLKLLMQNGCKKHSIEKTSNFYSRNNDDQIFPKA